MNKFIQIIVVFLLLYAAACIILYFLQEKLIFFPEKLPADHVFLFENFEDISHKVDEEITINSVLFASKEKKGVVFFLHGNAGSINGWGQGASTYLESGYDIMYLDYRGYGKSNGNIQNEKQLIDDAQVVYNYLKKRYTEHNIILSGTSIGTGIAAKIAALNHPRRLILNSPYYSLRSLIKEKVPVVPAFIIKYPLETAKYLEKVGCPVTIFHGDRDDIIPVRHSIDLKEKFPKAALNIIEGYSHNDLPESKTYRMKMAELLEK